MTYINNPRFRCPRCNYKCVNTRVTENTAIGLVRIDGYCRRESCQVSTSLMERGVLSGVSYEPRTFTISVIPGETRGHINASNATPPGFHVEVIWLDIWETVRRRQMCWDFANPNYDPKRQERRNLVWM